MRRAFLVAALLVSAAGSLFLQTPPARSNLAALMPGGAILYLEAGDFGRLLREWDASKVKADWLDSANYSVFSRSNLFSKLSDVYAEYGAAADLLAGLNGVIQIAGTESALALYEIREVEFLYISRVPQAQLAQSQVWTVRDKFEQRQAGGVTFYLRTDPASKRTVAFAFANGYLFLATRDDLIAQALTLLAGTAGANLASDRWYQEPTGAVSRPGELRLVMNLESLVKSVYFRSYWVQRNGSVISQYWAGIADVNRSSTNITETRVLLRSNEQTPPPANALSSLVTLIPPEAGLYVARNAPSSEQAAAFVVHKLIAAPAQQSRDWRYAPSAVSPDGMAGSESDLETRIDEPPLPVNAGISGSIAPIQSMLEKGSVQALLQVQSSLQTGGTFIKTPAVIVLSGSAGWDQNLAQTALAAAVEPLWTTSGLGAGWVSATAGRHSIQRLDGLGSLMFAVREPLLFLGNDPALLASVLDQTGATPPADNVTYAAGFRHSSERRNYDRIMTALDPASPAWNRGFEINSDPERAPQFFSGNLASLSRVLSRVSELRVTQEDSGAKVVQTVVYQIAP